MRIVFQREGGVAYFPGLARPVNMDLDTMPEEDANSLRQAVYTAHFFDLPRSIGPRQATPDAYSYTVTVFEGRRRHTVRLRDPIPEELQPLMSCLQRCANMVGSAGQREDSGE